MGNKTLNKTLNDALTPLGRGISLRRSFLKEFVERMNQEDPGLTSRLDWVEITPENFIGRGGLPRRALFEIAERFPVTFHGVSLSIGSMDELDWEFLSQLKRLARDLRVQWYTDHLSYSSINGVQFHNLLPLPFTFEAVRHVVSRVKQIQEFLEMPFGLENPSTYLQIPGAEMSEAEFISEVVEQADCHLVLDVNNVYVNSFNHEQAAMKAAQKFLASIPTERVMEVHIAGHRKVEIGGKWTLLDTHGASVCQSVKSLLKEFHEISPIGSLLLEREKNLPSLDEVLDELGEIWEGMRGVVTEAETEVVRWAAL